MLLLKHKNLTTNQTHLHKPKINDNVSLTSQLLSSNLFTHGEVMYRKSLYEKIGGYREFFMFTQDYDLWLRMSINTSFQIVEEVLYRRYVLDDGVSGSLEKQTLQRYFGEMARQGIESKLRGEKDLVDQYGYYAPFYRNSSSR
ncbi:MAG: hypothetical protein U5K84_06360 [Alkalibacterium sp.]|nr:hypothetical protein [Alkalibacterium sp.]